MQNEYIPLLSICLEIEYGAGGKNSPLDLHLYCIWSISSWLCSTLTPIAKDFFSSLIPFSWSKSNISLDEWPVAKIILEQFISLPLFKIIFWTFLFFNTISDNLELNNISPP